MQVTITKRSDDHADRGKPRYLVYPVVAKAKVYAADTLAEARMLADYLTHATPRRIATLSRFVYRVQA